MRLIERRRRVFAYAAAPLQKREKGLPFLVNKGAEEVTGGNLHQTLQRFDYSSYIKATGERAVLICWSHYAGAGGASKVFPQSHRRGRI
jgi:hypothetical protein